MEKVIHNPQLCKVCLRPHMIVRARTCSRCKLKLEQAARPSTARSPIAVVSWRNMADGTPTHLGRPLAMTRRHDIQGRRGPAWLQALLR